MNPCVMCETSWFLANGQHGVHKLVQFELEYRLCWMKLAVNPGWILGGSGCLNSAEKANHGCWKGRVSRGVDCDTGRCCGKSRKENRALVHHRCVGADV